MQNKIDIVIDSMFRGGGMVEADNAIRKFVAGIGKRTKSISSAIENSMGARGGWESPVAGLSKTMKPQLMNINKASSKAMMDMEDDWSSGIGRFTKDGQKRMTKLRRGFNMEFLGIMFLGMQLQKTFTSLAKSTFGSFMKITEGMHPAAQAANALGATWEMLKFSIGEALGTVLQQVLPALIPIITTIADWVQQHQKLVGWLIIGGIVLGAMLFVVGQMALGIQALTNFISNLTVMFGPLLEAITGSTLGWSGLITVLGWAILIAALLYAAWVANFGGIQEFVKNTLGIIVMTVGEFVKDLWNLFKILFEIIVAIFEGDWQKVWMLTKKFFIQFTKMIGKLLGGLIMIVWNFQVFAFNIFKDLFMSILKLLFTAGKGIVDAFIWLGETIALAIAKPLDLALSAIAGLIRGAAALISKVPGFGGTANKLRGMANTLSGIFDEENLKAAGQSLRNDVNANLERILDNADKLDEKLTMGYLGKDNLGEWNDMLERGATQLEKDWGVVDDAVNKPIEKNIAVVDETIAKSGEAVAASESLSNQNIVEADSWAMKNEEIERYMANLQSLGVLTQGGEGGDLSDSLPNFAQMNLN